MISIEHFNKNFYKNGANGTEFLDSFRTSVLVLPFTSNPSTSNYDRSCGLRGITGEFFRRCKDRQAEVIEDFEKNAINPVKDYLLIERNMKEKQAEEFIKIMKDIMYADGTLTVIDPSFLKFLPLKVSDVKSKKYEHGQKRIAEYLSSMLSPKDLLIKRLSKKSNLFNNIIISALNKKEVYSELADDNEYIILPFIKDSFGKDLEWLLDREDSIVVKYIHIFLHFYLCYSLAQTLAYLDPRKYAEPICGPKKMYFILASEHSSETCEAATEGWAKYVNKEAIEKLYGRIQTLDILNSLLGGNIGFFNDVYKALQNEPFTEEVKATLENLLSSYQKDKRKELENRENAKFQMPDEIEINVTDYEKFINDLSTLCISLQSNEYRSKMRIRVNGIMKIRMLSTRRGKEILHLDDEMLFFLMAMICKGRRILLKDLYDGFESYGIRFNNETKTAIENYLLKLNLLERKSDSGEAQYVEIKL